MNFFALGGVSPRFHGRICHFDGDAVTPGAEHVPVGCHVTLIASRPSHSRLRQHRLRQQQFRACSHQVLTTMFSRHGAAACYWVLLSWLSFITVYVVAQSTPESAVTSFSNLPSRLFFFDDTEVSVLYSGVDRQYSFFSLSRSLSIMTHYMGMSTCRLTKAELGIWQRGYQVGRLP